MRRTARLAVLASGRGSNLAALARAFGPECELGQVSLVVSERERAPALGLARELGLDAMHIPWGERRGFERQLARIMEERGIDLICLAGFMRLLSPEFTRDHWGRVLNVHPSLLPAFPGLRAHEQALQAGVSESGCTVHFVDAGVDTGPPIVQKRVPVLPGDTPETLAERILEQEHHAYPEAVRLVLTGEARP